MIEIVVGYAIIAAVICVSPNLDHLAASETRIVLAFATFVKPTNAFEWIAMCVVFPTRIVPTSVMSASIINAVPSPGTNVVNWIPIVTVPARNVIETNASLCQEPSVVW